MAAARDAPHDEILVESCAGHRCQSGLYSGVLTYRKSGHLVTCAAE